ncbi:hypothetical protein [Roseicella aquatilis]|uniref:Uncharacterized protein n=1 Tax=Roseicella aquatilis TaxID=2527868 RepID=A0A4R4DEX3_9PROT|nr:hypothetical protein [Roseicella aquatilis]TCZ58602.1 hypothetical protein EXY23_16845 [Roseicella aquatilis]
MLALAMAGCGALGSPPPAKPPPLPVASAAFDGRYTGSLQVAGAGVGMNRTDCETTPRLLFEVVDGRFTLPLPRPRLERATPAMAGRPVPSYEVLVAADGTVRGISPRTNTELRGRVEGRRMTGRIGGLLCSYDFTADRG